MYENVIPSGSVVTPAMVNSYAGHENVEATEESAPGLVGTLVELENGNGQVPEWMLTDDVFIPLVAAFDAKKPTDQAAA